jgi:hypothetical protein
MSAPQFKQELECQDFNISLEYAKFKLWVERHAPDLWEERLDTPGSRTYLKLALRKEPISSYIAGCG